MLFPQLPPGFVDGMSAELGFNFGLLAGKIETMSEEHQTEIRIRVKGYFYRRDREDH